MIHPPTAPPPCHGSVTVANATALAAAVAATSRSAPCVVLLSAREYQLTGELKIARSVTAQPAVPGDEAVLRASSDERVLSVVAGIEVTLEGVRITGARVKDNGGGILNHGNLTLIGSSVVDNHAHEDDDYDGGGMYNYGIATLRNVTIWNNTAGASGGGMYNDGNATLRNVIISGNTATAGADGGGIANYGNLTLTGSSIVDNHAHEDIRYSGGAGGGMYNGAYYGGSATSDYGGSATLLNVTISNNFAGLSGGGIFNVFNVTLFNVTITNNTAKGYCVEGGGGGMHNYGGTATLLNVTISSNTAGGFGGGIMNDGMGSGTFTDGGNVTLLDVTISNNTARLDGGGIHNIFGLVVLQASTLSANSPDDLANAGTAVYLLPAPLGHYVEGALLCVEQTCKIQPCFQYCPPSLFGNPQPLRTLPQGSLNATAFLPECAAGFYAGNSADPDHQRSELCAGPCPAGHVCPQPGTIVPAPVALGSYSPAGASEPTRCSLGSFGDPASLDGERKSQADACVLCPFNTTTLFAGATDSASCVCQPDFFDDLGRDPDNATDPTSGARRCDSCPHGFDCTAPGTTTLTGPIQEGFWRPFPNATAVKPCPINGTCLGRGGLAGDALCGDGFGGTYCAGCVNPTHYLDTLRIACRPCGAAWALLGGVLGIVVTLVLVIALSGRIRRALVRLANGVRHHQRIAQLMAASAAVTLRIKLKVLLGYGLLVAQLADVYQIRYPPDYQSTSSFVFSPLRLDLFGWIPGLHLRCFGIGGLLNELLLYTLLPLSIVCVSLVASWVRRRSLLPVLPAVLRFTSVLYPAVSSKGFQTLAPCDCFDIDGQAPLCFLRTDYSVECPGHHAPTQELLTGVFAVAVYGAGVPLLYGALLFTCRTAILNEEPTPLSKTLGFLHASVQPQALWWPLVETARALLLTGFLALVQPGELLQLLCGLLVAIVFLVLQLHFAPYRTASNNSLAAAVNLSLVLNFVSDIGVQMKAEYGVNISTTLLSVALFAAAFTVFPITLLSLLAALRPPPAKTLAEEPFLDVSPSDAAVNSAAGSANAGDSLS